MSPFWTVRPAIIGPLTGLALLLAACEKPRDPTVKETPIKVVTETLGVGRPAELGDTVTINYRIFLEDGREVLEADGYRFILGNGSVISGIDMVVDGMKIAGKRKVLCPPQLHWGRGGYGGVIPPDETLTIVVNLEAID